MNREFKYVVVLIVISLAFYLTFNFTSINYSKLTTVKNDDCNNSFEKIYNDSTMKVYSYCVKEINLLMKDDEKSLVTMLKDNTIDIDEVWDWLYKKYKGTTHHNIYKDGGSQTIITKDFYIAKCHVLPKYDKNYIISYGSKEIALMCSEL